MCITKYRHLYASSNVCHQIIGVVMTTPTPSFQRATNAPQIATGTCALQVSISIPYCLSFLPRPSCHSTFLSPVLIHSPCIYLITFYPSRLESDFHELSWGRVYCGTEDHLPQRRLVTASLIHLHNSTQNSSNQYAPQTIRFLRQGLTNCIR